MSISIYILHVHNITKMWVLLSLHKDSAVALSLDSNFYLILQDVCFFFFPKSLTYRPVVMCKVRNL